MGSTTEIRGSATRLRRWCAQTLTERAGGVLRRARSYGLGRMWGCLGSAEVGAQSTC